MTPYMRRAGIAALVGLATLAPAGTAHGYSYPDQRPAEDVRLYAMLGAATQYWTDRAPAGCASPRIALAPSLMDTDGIDAEARAIREDCTIVMRRDSTLDALHFMRERVWPVRIRRQMFQQECAIVTHEAGHLRGLDHAPSGVMALRPEGVPYTCAMLSRVVIPRTHRRHR